MDAGLNPPPQHVEDVLGAAQFYINKIRMQYPKAAVGDEPSVHSVWTTSIMSFLSSLKQYCQKHHSTGPSWNDSSNGLDLKEFKSEINPKADGVAKQGSHSGPPPPPPPPLPSASSLTKPRAQSSENSGKKQVAALFAEINRGESITSGLRKVTDDMKSKNKKDRSGTVPNGGQSEIPSGNTASKRINQHQATQTSSPRLECEQGRKWVVENYAGEKNVQVGPANPRQSVYIFNCHDCTICIQGKVNAVTIDACMKCGVVLETVVASCEVVNSRKIEVQATGLMPTVCIDSTDGCRLYLTKAAALETDITSSKSSEMNVVILGDMETEDVEECPLPEHYVSKYKGPGKGFVTEPVVHGA